MSNLVKREKNDRCERIIEEAESANEANNPCSFDRLRFIGPGAGRSPLISRSTATSGEQGRFETGSK